MFSEFSELFNHYDLNKYYSAYEGQKINERVETFRLDCNQIKANMKDINFNYESI